MQSVPVALRKYAVFSGRASRAEYWLFIGFYLIAYWATVLLDVLLGTYNDRVGVGLVSTLFNLSMVVPTLAVATRRLHDTNRSGWWQLLYLTIIGGFVMLAFLLLKGQAGPNRFGPDPEAPPVAKEPEQELVHT